MKAKMAIGLNKACICRHLSELDSNDRTLISAGFPRSRCSKLTRAKDRPFEPVFP